MQAGRLRHVVTIEQATETRNAIGEKVPTWSTFDTVRAGIRPLSGRELDAARQRFAEASHEVELRYLPGLTPKMRFKFGMRILDIGFIRNVEERNRQLLVDVVERNI